MDKFQSWFSNPMVDKDHLSVTEISILDQYVTDMISFSQGALSELKSKHSSTSSNSKKSSGGNNNISVQDMVSLMDPVVNSTFEKNQENDCVGRRRPLREEDKNEDDSNNNEDDDSIANNSKCESIIIEDVKTPSEEDLLKGVFTEVSCAGNVIKTKEEIVKEAFKPVPSPRVKRKARKEQMLLEHKEMGRQALSVVMQQLKQEPPTNNTITNNGSDLQQHQTSSMIPKEEEDDEDDGLQCLDDLCTQSRHIEKELNTKLVKKDVGDDCDTMKVGG